MRTPTEELDDILAELRGTDEHEGQEEIGRARLAGLLLHHNREVLDPVLKLARRDNRMRRCLSAARYYSGLDEETCRRIDQVLHVPFPAAAPRGKGRSR